MGRKNWDKVADKEFNSMPDDFQHDWEDLRSKTAH